MEKRSVITQGEILKLTGLTRDELRYQIKKNPEFPKALPLIGHKKFDRAEIVKFFGGLIKEED